MLRALSVTLLFVAFAMPSAAAAEALEPAPADDPFEAAPAPPPQPPAHFQGRGADPCAGLHGRGRVFRQRSGHGYGPPSHKGDRTGRGFGFAPGEHGGRSGFGRGFSPRHGPSGAGRGRGREALLFSERARRKLGLSQEQTDRMHQLRLESRRNAIRTRADLETKQLDLGELLRAAEPDRAAIDRTIQDIGMLRAAQMKSGINLRLDLRGALTPEQREQLREFREHRSHSRRPRRDAKQWEHRGRPGRRTPTGPRHPAPPSPPPSPPEP